MQYYDDYKEAEIRGETSARAVVNFYSSLLDGVGAAKLGVEYVLTDLLADIQHFCNRRKLDFEELLESATNHYEIESGQKPEADDLDVWTRRRRLRFEINGRPLRPGEVKPADYKLNLTADSIQAAAISVTIDGIEDGNGGMDIIASVPTREDLPSPAHFWVELDGDQFDVVEITFLETGTGEYEEDVIGGAVKGVFLALLSEHRIDLDQLRCNSAYLAEVGLELAGGYPVLLSCVLLLAFIWLCARIRRNRQLAET